MNREISETNVISGDLVTLEHAQAMLADANNRVQKEGANLRNIAACVNRTDPMDDHAVGEIAAFAGDNLCLLGEAMKDQSYWFDTVKELEAHAKSLPKR